MADETVMMRVLPKDKAALAALYGKPTHKALERLLTDNCPHPDGERVYTTGWVPMIGKSALIEKNNVSVSGFYCKVCRRYVFPGLGTAVSNEQA